MAADRRVVCCWSSIDLLMQRDHLIMMRLILIALFAAFLPVSVQAATQTAMFAGGCFWCMESEYQDIEGVESVISGFSGGSAETATYEAVSRGDTGHREVVQITYDPAKVGYAKLLEIFWDNVDPFDDEGQFCDKGFQYTAAIFVNDDQERRLAKESLAKIEQKTGKAVKTAILDSEPFYPAEEYHQDYFEKNAVRYKLYKQGCGRDARLEDVRRTLE